MPAKRALSSSINSQVTSKSNRFPQLSKHTAYILYKQQTGFTQYKYRIVLASRLLWPDAALYTLTLQPSGLLSHWLISSKPTEKIKQCSARFLHKVYPISRYSKQLEIENNLPEIC